MSRHEPVAELTEIGTNTERLVFFSDAVFAIAITLLVLEIRIPELPDGTTTMQQLMSIVEIWPRMLSFVISFLVIAAFWAGHHRMFTFIDRYDNGLIWINFALLLCIAFMPVPTAFLGSVGTQLVPVVFYGIVLTLTSFASSAIWRHAVNKQLVIASVDSHMRSLYTRRSLLTMLVCALSIPVAFLSPTLATFVWILIFFVRRAADQMTLRPSAHSK